MTETVHSCMTAIVVQSHGGPEEYRSASVPVPEPGPDQVLVEVSVAGVNFLDVAQRRGGTALRAPFRAGVEGVGRVVALGSAVGSSAEPESGHGLGLGDRVGWLTGGQGSYSAFTAVLASKLVPIPDDIDDETAAAALMQGITAHYLTTDTHPVASGDVVLVHAAAGGLGQWVTQIAAAAGATVYATASTEAKARIARSKGATDVFGYDDFADRVLAATGGLGATVVYDGVGGPTFDGDLKAARTRGTVVIVGNAGGPIQPVDVGALNANGSLFLTRPTVVDHVRTPAELQARAAQVFAWIREGAVTIEIASVQPLAEVSAAFELVESRSSTGKVLLRH